MLIDKAEESPNRERILQTPAFQRDFSDMMRQVDTLYDNLKLYNQSLMETLQNNHQYECEQ